ncbi:hypothetical protein KJZ61_01580 [Candidatus Dependentiae bacterium]|nr:hypothetical protein [Candidatus Dependentiae bacterium]
MKNHSIAIALLVGFCSVTGKPDPSQVIRATALLNQINPQPSTINQTPVSQAPRFTSGFTDLTNLAQNTHTTRFSIQNGAINFQNNSDARQPATPAVVSNPRQRRMEPAILNRIRANLLDQFNEVADNNNQLSDDDSSSDDGWVYEAINQEGNHSTQYMLQINEPIWEEVIRQHNERI